jgi:hypothetical protein
MAMLIAGGGGGALAMLHQPNLPFLVSYTQQRAWVSVGCPKKKLKNKIAR